MKPVIIHPSANSILCNNGRIVEDDRELFLEAYDRATRFACGETVTHVDIYLGDRKENGWLEHGIYVRKQDNRGLFIAAIQRTVGATCEFHS